MTWKSSILDDFKNYCLTTSIRSAILATAGLFVYLWQGSQTHLGVRATLQDIIQLVGRIVFRDDKMQQMQ